MLISSRKLPFFPNTPVLRNFAIGDNCGPLGGLETDRRAAVPTAPFDLVSVANRPTSLESGLCGRGLVERSRLRSPGGIKVPSLPRGGLDARASDVALLQNNTRLEHISTAQSASSLFFFHNLNTDKRLSNSSKYDNKELDTGELHSTSDLQRNCFASHRYQNCTEVVVLS
jgi:hypothetical protein